MRVKGANPQIRDGRAKKIQSLNKHPRACSQAATLPTQGTLQGQAHFPSSVPRRKPKPWLASGHTRAVKDQERECPSCEVVGQRGAILGQGVHVLVQGSAPHPGPSDVSVVPDVKDLGTESIEGAGSYLCSRP